MKHSLIVLAAISAPYSAGAAEAPAQELGKIVVEDTAIKGEDTHYSSPTTTITADEVDNINATTVEDAIKYEPGLVVRRRYIGDSNGTLGIRGSNMFQTARSMVYSDGMPLHYLLESRWNGAPRWSLVAADETESVEVVYGPFSAEYSGNAMGGVVNIKTKLPQKEEFNAEAGIFMQDFSYLGNDDTYTGHREFVSYGNKYGNLSLYAFHNHLDNNSQPQSFRYNSISTPVGGETVVTGGYKESDSVGVTKIYYGDSGSEAVVTDLTKLKLGYEFGRWLARFTLAYEDREKETNSPTNYLRDSSGNLVWSGTYVMGSDLFTVKASHFAVSEQNRETVLIGAGLEGALNNNWSLDSNVSIFDVLDDTTLSSNVNPLDPSFDGSGRVKEYDDTGWLTLDVKARNKRFLNREDMNLLLGYHYDHYRLNVNDYNSTNYAAAIKSSQRSATGGDTMMHAAFAQLAWYFDPQWDMTLGGRYETWKTEDGYYYNYGASNLQDHASRTESGFSPKLSFGYVPDMTWSYRYSLAKAYRFPIVEELFKNEYSTNGTLIADAELKPEKGIHQNFSMEKRIKRGFLRTNVFHEVVKDVIFNQSITLSDSSTVSTFLPIDEVTTSGIEFVAQQARVNNSKVDLRFNVSYINSKVTAHAANPSVVGNVFPRMPKWRANLLTTYHVDPQWNTSAGLRYASDSFGRLDNTDTVDQVMSAQDAYLFLDLKANYKINKTSEISFGIDNVTDEIAFVAHPWPQRTYYIQGKIHM